MIQTIEFPIGYTHRRISRIRNRAEVLKWCTCEGGEGGFGIGEGVDV